MTKRIASLSIGGNELSINENIDSYVNITNTFTPTESSNKLWVMYKKKIDNDCLIKVNGWADGDTQVQFNIYNSSDTQIKSYNFIYLNTNYVCYTVRVHKNEYFEFCFKNTSKTLSSLTIYQGNLV